MRRGVWKGAIEVSAAPGQPAHPRIRQSDIAQVAGVGVSSVSRVLRDRPGVSSQTRDAVLAALDALGYEPPVRLRARGRGLVGLVMPGLTDPFLSRLADLLELGLSRLGYTPLLCVCTFGGLQEDDYVSTLLSHGVSGIVFVSGLHAMMDSDASRYRRLAALGLPMVLINGYHEGLGAACVSTDDAAVVDLAVAHLARLKHRRIGLALGPRRRTSSMQKAAAFVDAMRAHVHPDLVPGELDTFVYFARFTIDGGEEAARGLLDAGATALVCASDMMAVGALRGARSLGHRVPEDVSVVGADDSLLMAYLGPPLTTVRQPVMALADQACQHLLAAITGQSTNEALDLLTPELVVRSSTGPATGG